MTFKLSEILRYCEIFSFQTPIGSQRILMVVALIFPPDGRTLEERSGADRQDLSLTFS
jgi:hypothetical protein